MGRWAALAVLAPCVGGFLLPAAHMSARKPLALGAKKESLSTLMEDFKKRQWKDAPVRPVFEPGDTVRIGCEIVEGKTTRIQNYEGVVITRSGSGELRAGGPGS